MSDSPVPAQPTPVSWNIASMPEQGLVVLNPHTIVGNFAFFIEADQVDAICEALQNAKEACRQPHLDVMVAPLLGPDGTPILRSVPASPEGEAHEQKVRSMEEHPAGKEVDDMQEFGESKVGQPADDLPRPSERAMENSEPIVVHCGKAHTHARHLYSVAAELYECPGEK